MKRIDAMEETVKGMTYSEIGSHFWLDEASEAKAWKGVSWLPETPDSTFTFSGRAAIELALRDILREREVKKIYAPSYCCLSMLQAFIDRGMEIRYYEVTFENGAFQYKLDYGHDCDIVLIMNYFGIGVEKTHEAIGKLRSGKAVIIEDITHSLLNRTASSPHSDYLVASLRKWFAIPTGGWLGKAGGRLSVKPNLPGDDAAQGKLRAMREKARYIAREGGKKEEYLPLYARFEEELAAAGCELTLDSVSYGLLCGTDAEFVKQRRRSNALELLRGLRELDSLILSFQEPDLAVETPLFFPVFLERERRDALRKELTGNGIYCPIHWPEIPGAPAGIRENELSLVCDQRYTKRDMKAILNIIYRQ